MDLNLAVMVAESARRTPGKPAVILGKTTISYAQLDAQSDRVAASLTAAGVTAGDRVGLQLPNIPQFVDRLFRDTQGRWRGRSDERAAQGA